MAKYVVLLNWTEQGRRTAKDTVTRFEQEMRALEFRPWRVAIRTQDLIEYTPEIEHYPMQDLATTELYSSWINKKKARTA